MPEHSSVRPERFHTIKQICPFPFDMMKQVIITILYILPVTIKHDLAGG